MESAELVVIGCGPAGATAAREAARGGMDTLVLERDGVIGSKRVCAAGLRPGFYETFDVPRAIVHCQTPRLALFDDAGREYEVPFGAGTTTTREELDATLAELALREGARIATQALFRSIRREPAWFVVEYADLARGERRTVRARRVFFAQGATARLEDASSGALAMRGWRDGLLTTLQYRVYLDRPASPITYRTLELHYYAARDRRRIVAWMFPKRDHLAIGLGVIGKMDGGALRAELDAFTERVRARLYPHAAIARVKTEGHLLYAGLPRPRVADAGMFVGGTAAGFVDATNGEGIFEAAMSGRFAADAIVRERASGRRAGLRYARHVAERLQRRLAHRVGIIRYLEHRPSRFGLLFGQLASTPRLAHVLLKEDCERTFGERCYLYGQALRFGARTLACAKGEQQ